MISNLKTESDPLEK